MKLAILCLCLAGTASAAPSAFHYLTHYTGSRPQLPPSQVTSPFAAAQPLPQTALPGAYSVELIYPHRFPGGTGTGAGQSFHGFLKYSIPQPPGRQSVEVYYPYDFSQQRIITNIPPMTNIPQTVLPFDFPLQNIPPPPMNIPSFDASPLPSQDPMQPLQADQPTPVNKMPAKV